MNTTSDSYEYLYTDSNALHHHNYLMPALLKLLSQQDFSPGQKTRVLDIGCGNGSLSHLISQHGYEIVGVEESESGVNLARQTFPDIHFMQASIYDLPFKDLENSFDFVVSAEVIEHLFYPKELIRAAKRCLKPNGRLIITTPYHGYLKNLALALSGKLDKHFTVDWDGGHIKFFSVATLTQFLEAEGLTDIKFVFAGRLPYLWKSMLCSSRLP